MSEPRALSVLMVSVGWPAETFIASSISSLAQAGVDLCVAISLKPGQVLPGPTAFRCVALPSWNQHPARKLAILALMFFRKATAHPRATARLARLIRRRDDAPSRVRAWFRLLPFVGLRPDILHFQWNSSAIDYGVLFEFFACPAIVSCRGSQVQVAPHNPQRRASLLAGLGATFDKAAAVHCVASAIAESARQYGLTPEKTVVIRPAVDLDLFQPGAVNPRARSEPLRIVTAATLTWVKDLERALNAVRDAVTRRAAVEFDIYGDGPDRQRLLYTIQDLGLSSVARLHGRVSQIEWRNALRRAHVFLLTSVSEGISNAALEAMACGVPVVTTDCGGMREAVRDGVDGLVVPLRAHGAVADRLLQLAGDEDLRARLGHAATERVAERFALSVQTSEWVKLYASLKERRRRPDSLTEPPTTRASAA